MVKIIGNILLIILLSMMFIVGVSVLPLPKNFRIYSVTTGSMSPKIKVNSLIFIKPIEEYKASDIVTIKTSVPGKTVTHRIVRKINKNNQTFFETKGDANISIDLENVDFKNILGKVFYVIPYLGLPIAYSKTIPGLIFLIVIPATIIIYSEILNIKNELSKIFLKIYKKKKKKKKS